MLLSQAAFPASSRTSAHRRSRTAARHTGAPPPARWEHRPAFRRRLTRPTGNCRPALAEREALFAPDLPRPPFPFPGIIEAERADAEGVRGVRCDRGAQGRWEALPCIFYKIFFGPPVLDTFFGPPVLVEKKAYLTPAWRRGLVASRPPRFCIPFRRLIQNG